MDTYKTNVETKTIINTKKIIADIHKEFGGLTEDQAMIKVYQETQTPQKSYNLIKYLEDLENTIPMLNDEDIEVIVEKIRVIREEANKKYNLKHKYE